MTYESEEVVDRVVASHKEPYLMGKWVDVKKATPKNFSQNMKQSPPKNQQIGLASPVYAYNNGPSYDYSPIKYGCLFIG